MARTPGKLLISFFLFVSLACGLSDITGTSAPQQQPGELETAISVSLTGTAIQQTVIALGVSSTSNPGQPPASENPTQTPPELPSLTASLEISPTPDRPMVTVSQVTNCRSGPGSVYDWLGSLNIGQQAMVFGRDPANTSWYIRNPNNASGFCWIYGSFATITGNTGSVPVFTPMPTPTPARTATPTTPPMDFMINFKEIDTCGGPTYYARFDVVNNSLVTWQSYQSTLMDTITSFTTLAYNSNEFDQYINCLPGVFQGDLTPGESGEIHSFLFPANPAGHLISATIKLCTLDDLGGSCLTKTFTFTP